MASRVYVLGLLALGWTLAACDAILGNLQDRPAVADAAVAPLLFDADADAGSGSDTGGRKDATDERDAATPTLDASYDVGLTQVSTVTPDAESPLVGIALTAGVSPVYFTSMQGSLFSIGPGLTGSVTHRAGCDITLAPGLVFWPPGSDVSYAVASDGQLVRLGGCGAAPMPGYYLGAPWTIATVAAGVTEFFWATLDGPVFIAPFPDLTAPAPFENAGGAVASIAFDQSRNALWYGTSVGTFLECPIGPTATCLSRGSFDTGSTSFDVSSFVVAGETLFIGTQHGLFVVPAMTMQVTTLPGTTGIPIGVLAVDMASTNVYWSQTTPEAPMFMTGVYTCPAAHCESAALVGQGPTDENVLQIAANESAVYWVTSTAILGVGR